jgi:hypothetical protein
MRLVWTTFLLLAALPCVGAETPPRNAAEPLPEAATVVIRILQRAAAVAEDTQPYLYTKRTKVEELDGKGRVQSAKEKVYEVTQIGGVTRARLIDVNAPSTRRVTMEHEARKEEETKQRLTASKEGRQRGRFEQVLTEELFARFDWTVERREQRDGRALLLLSFSPKEGLEADKLADRVINRLHGRLWVDETDWEVAQAEVRLAERVTLWGGLLGALDRFVLRIGRERSGEGPWFVRRVDVDIAGRKLLGAVHFRSTEEAGEFRRDDTPRQD